MNDERNFRSLYYEKVGCKSVEEKKSLEILFKDKTLDKNKIKQFCSRFTVPFVYRCYLWKFLLGVIPAQKNCHEFIMKERSKQYYDLLHGLNIINGISPEVPKEEQYLQMWLMEQYQLMYDRSAQLSSEFHQNMLAVTRTIIGIFESDVDVYWIAKGFFDYIKSWYATIPYLIESTKTLLLKEDSALYSHLLETDLINKIPMDTWFGRCFAGVLHDTALVKVWDKMICSSFRVLIFVCAVLLKRMRRVLLTCLNIKDLLSCVQSLTNETAEVIVSQSLEMWQAQSRSIIHSPMKEQKTPSSAHQQHKIKLPFHL